MASKRLQRLGEGGGAAHASRGAVGWDEPRRREQVCSHRRHCWNLGPGVPGRDWAQLFRPRPSPEWPVGLQRPLRISVWHGLVSIWEQTKTWMLRGRGKREVRVSVLNINDNMFLKRSIFRRGPSPSPLPSLPNEWFCLFPYIHTLQLAFY